MSGDLMGMKENFTSMVQKVQPWILSHFMMWLDLKVAEYKVHGCMILDQTGISSPRWLSDNICSQTTRIPKLTHVTNENKDEDNAFQAMNQSAMFPGETSSKPHNNQPQINFLPNPITNNFNRKTSSLASCLSSPEIQIQEFPSSSPSVSSSLLNLPKRQDSYRNENELAPNMTIPLHHAMAVEENNQRTIDRIEIHSSDNLNSSSVNGFQKANLEKDCMNLEEEMNLNYDVEIKAEPFSSFSEEEVNLQSNCATQYDILGSVGKMNQNDVNQSIGCEGNITQSKGTITIDLNGKILEEDTDNIMMSQKPQLGEQQQHHMMQQQQQSSALPPVESLTGRMFLHQIPVINLQNCNVRKVTSTTGRNKKSVPAVLSSSKLSTNSNNTRGKFICQTCGKIFRCLSSLSRHKWLHREKRHRCFVCKRAFHRKDHLYLHLDRQHAKSNEIPCPICAMKSNDLHSIYEHIRQCHQNIS
ncbi:uncharacterized protein LOC115213480 isoform X2 [Octopus sinensis]|uniref:Uncharacterized protein LOC115213480 isoform X2 n=1 Tax=Octopus sinensis TaxID=2607531 RepID=A0A6P7SK38_9MOLL|nr:uncharacterized protein LOC115213480 isoform X2 [Octopus sinensis]